MKVRSAAAQQMDGVEAKIEATWNPDDPIFSPRERAALQMATMFTENYHSFNDVNVVGWGEHFTPEEIIELATFMALADGFGKVVEMLGLGEAEQACKVEI